MSGLKLQTSYWNILDLNLNISKSILPKMTMTICKRGKDQPDYLNRLLVMVYNSPLQHLIGCYITLHVSEVSIIDPQQSNRPVFMLENSIVEIMDSTFQGIYVMGQTDDAPAVLYINNCLAQIKGSKFLSSTSYAAAISSYRSNISINKCQFELNQGLHGHGSALMALWSNVSVKTSKFKQNQAMQGGVLNVQYFSNLTIEQCTFDLNKAIGWNGTLFKGKLRRLRINTTSAEPYPKLHLGNVYRFTKTESEEESVPAYGGVIYGARNVAITITQSEFNNNSALGGAGGAIFTGWNVPMTVIQSRFIGNTATDQGVAGKIYGSQNVTSPIVQSEFHDAIRGTDTIDGSGGAIYGFLNVTATIIQSQFVNNTATVGGDGDGGAIVGNRNITINITQSWFIENSAARSGGAILMMDNSMLEVHNSLFTNNTAYFGGALNTQDHVKATFANTSFINNSAIKSSTKAFYDEEPEQARQGKNELNEYSDTTKYNIARKYYMYNNLKNDVNAKLHGLIENETQTRKVRGQNEGNLFKQILIRGNDETSLGGAICVAPNATISILTSMFIGNKADNGFGGAVVAAKTATVHIEDTVFEKNSAGIQGGAMNVQLNVTMVMKNTILSNNQADRYPGGGLVAMTDADLYFTNITFHNNTAKRTIGALYVGGNSRLTVTNSRFTNNTGHLGNGAIVITSSTANIMGCNFSGNTGHCLGSKNSTIKVSKVIFTHVAPNIIYLISSRLNMSQFCIQNNSLTKSAPGSENDFLIAIKDNSYANLTKSSIVHNDFPATGLVNIVMSTVHLEESNIMYNNLSSNLKVSSGFLSVSNVNVSVNNVIDGGGFISSHDGEITLTYCRVNENSAGGAGGVIHSYSGNMSILDSIFLSNSATGMGGVISIESEGYSSLSIVNTTFYQNHAEGHGAVIHAQSAEGNTLIDIALDTCNFTENTAPSDSALYLIDCSFLRTSTCYFEPAIHSNATQCIIYFVNAIYVSNTDYLSYRTQFHMEKGAISSQEHDFLQNAVSNGVVVVHKNGPYIVTNEETSYAGGELTNQIIYT